MPSTADTIKTEPKPKPRNKKGFREPTSLHVDPRLWQEVRIMAVLKNVSVTEYFEDALRRKLDIDNLEIGRQGYQVGQGGMYIPPPPPTKSTTSQSPQPSQEQQQGAVIHSARYEAARSESIPAAGPQGPKFDIFREDTKTATIEDAIRLGYVLVIPKLDFPTNKSKLIRQMKELKNDFNEKFKKVPVPVNHSLLLAEQLPDKMYNDINGIGAEWRILLNDRKITELLFGKPARVQQMWIINFNRTENESERDSEMREMVKSYHVKPGGVHFEEHAS